MGTDGGLVVVVAGFGGKEGVDAAAGVGAFFGLLGTGFDLRSDIDGSPLLFGLFGAVAYDFSDIAWSAFGIWFLNCVFPPKLRLSNPGSLAALGSCVGGLAGYLGDPCCGGRCWYGRIG